MVAVARLRWWRDMAAQRLDRRSTVLILTPPAGKVDV